MHLFVNNRLNNNDLSDVGILMSKHLRTEQSHECIATRYLHRNMPKLDFCTNFSSIYDTCFCIHGVMIYFKSLIAVRNKQVR